MWWANGGRMDEERGPRQTLAPWSSVPGSSRHRPRGGNAARAGARAIVDPRTTALYELRVLVLDMLPDGAQAQAMMTATRGAGMPARAARERQSGSRASRDAAIRKQKAHVKGVLSKVTFQQPYLTFGEQLSLYRAT